MNVLARLFFMAIPAFFVFLLTYIVFGMDKSALIGGLFIGAANALKAIKYENVPTVNPVDYIRRIRYSVIKKYRDQFFQDNPDLRP